MSLEKQQLVEIARLTAQVEQLQQQLCSITAEADQLRSSVTSSQESEQLQTAKAELDHERQKSKAVWAAVRHVAGEDTLRRIEEEVSRRPIVATPKVRRRGTMPHMPAPHITVVPKTTAAPKWPPAAQEESPAVEGPVHVAAAPIRADHSEEPKDEGEVGCSSVQPAVALRLTDLGFTGKDQTEPASGARESLPPSVALPIKVDKTSSTSDPKRERLATVPSPLRRREPSAVSSSGIPPLPLDHVSQMKSEPNGPAGSDKVSQKQPALVRSGSVRDRIRQLERSASARGTSAQS